MTLKPSCFSYSINFVGYATPCFGAISVHLVSSVFAAFSDFSSSVYLFPRELIYKGSCSEIFT